MGEASFDVQVKCVHEPPPRSTSREMERSKNPPPRPAPQPRSAFIGVLSRQQSAEFLEKKIFPPDERPAADDQRTRYFFVNNE